MAISAPLYKLLSSLKDILPHGGSLLEIGEANWYGDINPNVLLDAFPEWQDDLRAALCSGDGRQFAIAKTFYKGLFAPSRIVSVDMHGTDRAWKCDLNKPLPPLGAFDVVMNHGTAEHIFNIAQVFASMHTACKVGGLMIHDSPFTGWLDHGFYCLQPTLFYDLAAANGYEIIGVAIYEIRKGATHYPQSRDELTALLVSRYEFDNAMLFVALRKTSADAFRLPMQGYYNGTLSKAGTEAWSNLR